MNVPLLSVSHEEGCNAAFIPVREPSRFDPGTGHVVAIGLSG